MKRDWREFREKVEREGCCRVCRTTGAIQGAHIIQRSRVPGARAEHPMNCIPLCQECHQAYDSRDLDILPYLTPLEQAKAAELCNGLLGALIRTTNHYWNPAG